MHGSPYRDYDVNTIVSIIMGLPPEAKVIICGTSLGANNTPVAGAYAYLQNRHRIIHGIWGFQASIWGAQAYDSQTGSGDKSYPGITSNVLFAHLISSDFPGNFGLGAYRWKAAPGNTVTNDGYGPTLTTHNYPHPGDDVVADQNMFLAEMQQGLIG